MTAPDPVVTVLARQVSPKPMTMNISDRSLRIYEMGASCANVTADDVELLCASVFELVAVIRKLRDGAA